MSIWEEGVDDWERRTSGVDFSNAQLPKRDAPYSQNGEAQGRHAPPSVELRRIPYPSDELKVLADLTVALTKLRQNECNHLCIENFAPELWRALLKATYAVPALIKEPA